MKNTIALLCAAACALAPMTSEAFASEPVVYGKILYLQTSGSSLHYGAELNMPYPIPVFLPNTSPTSELVPMRVASPLSPQWKVLSIGQDYHPGFEVGAIFSLPNSGLRLALNWERLHSHDSASYATSIASGLKVGPLFDIGPYSPDYNVAYGKVCHHFDEISVNVEQGFCLGEGLQASLFGGIGFTHIKQTMHTRFSNENEEIARSIDTPSSFSGTGPQVGLNYQYELCNGLAFTGSSMASLFFGRVKNSTTFKTFSPDLEFVGIDEPNVQEIHVQTKSQVIPGFQQKFGLAYATCLNSYSAVFEVGYRYQIYVNAVRSVQPIPSEDWNSNLGVFVTGFHKNTDNFILSGPYASLNVTF